MTYNECLLPRLSIPQGKTAEIFFRASVGASDSASTREAIVAVVTTIHACHSDAVAVKAAAFAISGGSLILAVLLWTWQSLLGILTVAALSWLQKWMRL